MLEGEKMDTKNIKRIVAREGLIITSLIAAFSLCLLLSHWQSTCISKGVKTNLSELRNIQTSKPIESKSKEDSIFTSAQFNDDRDWSKMSDKEVLDEAGIPLKDRPLFQRINFDNWALFILFVVYPLYLLIRFIIWAIRTLRGQK